MTELPKELLKDYAQDEILDVKLPRRDYELFRQMLERERAYNWLGRKIRSFWVWALASGLLTIFALWDIFKEAAKRILN